MNKGFASIGLVILLFAALAIGGGGYWVMTQPSASIESDENIPTLRDFTSSNPQPQVQQTSEVNQVAPKPSAAIANTSANGSLTVATPQVRTLETAINLDQCNLTVDGMAYQILPCSKQNYGQYGIDYGAAGSKYFVTGVNTSVDPGGWWNGATASSHAHDPLPGGILTKVGNCYENARVRLCEEDREYILSDQKAVPTTADLAATIDSVVASPVTFTGTVSGSMSNLLGMNMYQKNPTYHNYYSGNVKIGNGRWAASLGTQPPPGTYIIDMYVLDGHSNFGSNNVVTTATLTVQ